MSIAWIALVAGAVALVALAVLLLTERARQRDRHLRQRMAP